MAQQSLSPFRIQAPKDLQPQNSIQNGNCVTLSTRVSCWFSNYTLIMIPGFLVHRFLGNTNKWICQILEFSKKILEFRDNFLSLGGKIRCFIGKICYFCLKITKICRIFEFRREICLSLAKNC